MILLKSLMGSKAEAEQKEGSYKTFSGFHVAYFMNQVHLPIFSIISRERRLSSRPVPRHEANGQNRRGLARTQKA